MTFASNATWIDLLIVLAYLGMLTLIGVYFSRKQSNLEEYFLASRSMSWLPVGMSLMAALNSGIDYIMQPSWVIIYGLVGTISVLSWFFLYRSEEHTSELQSHSFISYAVFCLKKKN